MWRAVSRVLGIRAGEETKTLLLYASILIFYVGLIWGESASETLFVSAWSAEDLSLMFVGNAVLAFGLALAYAAFADRFSNEHILQGMVIAMIAWLVSVRLLLDVAGGPHGAVYPYFYLINLAFRDLSTLQIVTYINDFYDTRSAKRVIPMMLSASVVGATLAGFTNPLLSRTIGVTNVPLMWLVTLVAVLILTAVIRRVLPAELGQIDRTRTAAVRTGTPLQNLAEGLEFVRGSGLLRWLALATFAMVVLMRLLNVQASQVFVAVFANDPQQLFNFYGVLGGVSNVCGILLQSVVVSRLVTRFGVGTLNLVFPSITLAAVSAMATLPSFPTAILGRLTHITFKQVFRNPLDAMLFNGVPLRIKGRSKAFVNGLVVPFGTLTAGLLLLAVRWGGLPFGVVSAVGVLLAAVYLFASFRVRNEYGRALTDLLAQDEMSAFRASRDDFEQADPLMIQRVERRLAMSDSEPLTIFLSEVLYEIQGQAALPVLFAVAADRGPIVCAGIVDLLARDGLATPDAREFCGILLDDPDANVRRAAVRALAAAPDVGRDRALLHLLAARLDEPVPDILAVALPALLASGEPEWVLAANRVLSDWLSRPATDPVHWLAIEALAQAGNARAIARLSQAMRDPSPATRHRAADLLGRLLIPPAPAHVQAAALDLIGQLLNDADEAVRRAAVTRLKVTPEGKGALLIALRDPGFSVRREACLGLTPMLRDELRAGLETDDYFLGESTAYLLAGRQVNRARQRLVEFIRDLVRDVYALRLSGEAFCDDATVADQLLRETLAEYGDELLDQVFWLAGALGNEAQAQVIRRSLQSGNNLTCANAAEALESLTSPQLARLIAPLYDAAAWRPVAARDLGLVLPDRRTVLAGLWPEVDGHALLATSPHLAAFYADGWATAVAIHAVVTGSQAPFDAEHVQGALQASRADRRRPVCETVLKTLAKGERGSAETGEASMLTALEKVIFLKEVPFFQGMTIQQLRTLGEISEQITYAQGQVITAEGDFGDALYAVVSGKVALQQHGKQRRDSIVRLGVRGPKEYFAEMAIFDDAPHEADAVALEPTELLLVRRAPLVELIKRQPDLALDLLRVMSQRLRQATATIAEKSQAKPKRLMDLYDKL